MPRPMDVVGAIVQTADGFRALFLDMTRAWQYSLDRANHQVATVDNLVTEPDALRYAEDVLRDRLPYGLESLIHDWKTNADDF